MDTAISSHSGRGAVRAHQVTDEFKGSRTVSPTEHRILILATKGFTDKEICREIGHSIATVRTHWSRLRRKLGVVNRAQAIAEWIDQEQSEHMRLLEAKASAMHTALNDQGTGVWEYHEDSGSIVADEISSRIFGNVGVTIDDFLGSVPPADCESLESHLKEPQEDGLTHRISPEGSNERLVRTKATRVESDDRTVIVCTSEMIKML